MKKVLVILGQTATGKSDLAVKMAKKYDGEVISADSRQIYKGLDIGTGKITKKETEGVPHHLLDIANPKQKFTVAGFQTKAISAIAEIIKKDKLPIICGGTGFYIDAICKGQTFPEVSPNRKLRRNLSLLDGRQLLIRLKELDPERADNIDSKNKVRLIRAIEVATALGKVPKIKELKPQYEFIKIGLYLPPDELRKKVESRVKKMFKAGLLSEIRKLKRAGISEKRLHEFGFEYDHPTPEKVMTATLKYAKRQMTWFKRDPEIKWFRPKEKSKITSFLKSEIFPARAKQKRP